MGKGARRVLEIGMFTGYGAAAIVEALPSDGECVSLDIDPFLKDWVGEVMGKFPQGKKHSVIVGPALDSMAKLPAAKKFDFVFVDANKSEYKRYIEVLLERNLLADDAIIAVDNTLYCGLPFMPAGYDTQPKRRGFGEDIREFNYWLANHPQLMTVMLPIRDGVTLVRNANPFGEFVSVMQVAFRLASIPCLVVPGIFSWLLLQPLTFFDVLHQFSMLGRDTMQGLFVH